MQKLAEFDFCLTGVSFWQLHFPHECARLIDPTDLGQYIAIPLTQVPGVVVVVVVVVEVMVLVVVLVVAVVVEIAGVVVVEIVGVVVVVVVAAKLSC